jgi:hypothetical protein
MTKPVDIKNGDQDGVIRDERSEDPEAAAPHSLYSYLSVHPDALIVCLLAPSKASVGWFVSILGVRLMRNALSV